MFNFSGLRANKFTSEILIFYSFKTSTYSALRKTLTNSCFKSLYTFEKGYLNKPAWKFGLESFWQLSYVLPEPAFTCSKLTVENKMWNMFIVCLWRRSGVFVVNFFHTFCVSIVNFEHVIAGWDALRRNGRNMLGEFNFKILIFWLLHTQAKTWFLTDTKWILSKWL